MRWTIGHKYDPECVELADRHYSRGKPGTPQFVPPMRAVILKTGDRRAVWVTTAPRFVFHAWPGAWVNTIFRNEGAGLSSELILEAVAATRALWRDVPDEGLITFVDPARIRRKRDPGRCYIRAGFELVGETARRSLLVFQLPPARFPEPVQPLLELEVRR